MPILLRKNILFVIPILLILFFYYQIFVPVRNFPIDRPFEIQRGATGEEIFQELKDKGYMRSVFYAKIVSKIFGMDKFFPEEYVFSKKLSTFELVKIVTTRPPSYAVLIPEGFTKKQVADRIANYVKNFDKQTFLKEAEEGYLYPDTYYFYSRATTSDILEEFNQHFYEQTFKNLGRTPTKNEVIIASMLEREARNSEDMKIISGIIQNRLKTGMALQIDSTVLYGQGAWKNRVLYKDLKHESDYNTYINTGLPIGPISNPGLVALEAAMNPQKSKYMYYLTGKDGKMYYSVTHEEHVNYKNKYLR